MSRDLWLKQEENSVKLTILLYLERNFSYFKALSVKQLEEGVRYINGTPRNSDSQ